MKKKNKKKVKRKLRKFKKRRITKLKKKVKRKKTNVYKKRPKKVRKAKIKKRKRIFKKRKVKVNQKKSLRGLTKIKFPKFKEQKKSLKKLTFQKIINFIFQPIFKSYDDYRENRRIQKLARLSFEKKQKEKQLKEEEKLRKQLKEQELKDEVKFAKLRAQDLKQFLRIEQAEIRMLQKEKEKGFLQQIRIEKKLDRFRKLEQEEIRQLEKFALKHQRQDYQPTLDRIDAIKERFRLLREDRIRTRIKALGVEISDSDTKEDLIKKEQEYTIERQQIEFALAPFFRSAQSLVFQLNKKYIPKHKSILRAINRIFETNELFVRYDDETDENWLLLIYLKDSDPKKGKVIIENRTNPEKNETKEFELKQIFAYSDYLVDVMTSHIDREFRNRKANENLDVPH